MSKEPRNYRDPFGPSAWYARIWAPMYKQRYAHSAEFGAKIASTTKSLFSKMGELLPDSSPEDKFDVLTSFAEYFISSRAFEWISHRDIASLNGNIYRIHSLWQEESDGEENTTLDALHGLEERLLSQAPSQIEGGKEVLALEQSRELAAGPS